MRLWRREDPKLRYYLYVSDNKLDMLFEQIEHSVLKRISAEVKVDLKLASVALKRADKPAPARMAKLRVVERFIERHHHVGDVEEPGTEYFRGRMAMTWGWLRWREDVDENGVPRRDMVLFQGQRRHHTVGLAGSGRHVLAWNGLQDGTTWALTSATAQILWALNQHVANTPELATMLRQNLLRNRLSRLRGGPAPFGRALNTNFFHGPSQQLEFLAVPLARDNARYERYHFGHHGRAFDDRFRHAQSTVLGTPLYVALAPGPQNGS